MFLSSINLITFWLGDIVFVQLLLKSHFSTEIPIENFSCGARKTLRMSLIDVSLCVVKAISDAEISFMGLHQTCFIAVESLS